MGRDGDGEGVRDLSSMSVRNISGGRWRLSLRPGAASVAR